MKIALFISIAVALIIATSKELPEKEGIVSFFKRLGLPFVAMILSFLIGSSFFMSPIAGIALAILGWVLTSEIVQYIETRHSRQARKQVKDFVTSATSLYMADNTTPEVVRITATYMKEPLASDINNMLSERQFRGTTFPVMFNRLADKYDVPEMGAVARIIEAGEITGGSRSIAKGLSRLGDAMRRRDKLLAERYKAILEPAIAAGLVIFILIILALIDGIALRGFFMQNGLARLSLGLGVGVITVLSVMLIRLFKSKE